MYNIRRTTFYVEDSKLTAFRLPSDLVKAIDKFAEALRTKEPGATVTRSDAVRVLLRRALAAVKPGLQKGR